MLCDSLALSGLVAIATGLWWMHPPTALIVTGSLVFSLAAFGAVNQRRDTAKRKLLRQVKRMQTLGPAAQEFEGAD